MLAKGNIDYDLEEIFLKNFTPRVIASPIPTIANATGNAVVIMLDTSDLMALNAVSTAVVIPSLIVFTSLISLFMLKTKPR